MDFFIDFLQNYAICLCFIFLLFSIFVLLKKLFKQSTEKKSFFEKNKKKYLRELFDDKTRGNIAMSVLGSLTVVVIILGLLNETGYMVIYITSFLIIDWFIFWFFIFCLPIVIGIIVYRIFSIRKFKQNHQLKFADEISKLEILKKIS